MMPSDRLRLARENAGYGSATEAARRFGWSPPTYMGHENGSRGVSPDAASRYARAFGVTPEWLLYGHGDLAPNVPAPRKAEEILVPVYDIQASAGNGSIVDEYEPVADRLSFPPGYLRRITSASPRDLAIISVKGDSMIPTLKDDDVVMLDMSKRSLAYDGLFVLRFDDALHVKRITRSGKRGSVTIVSDNRDRYPPIEKDVQDIEVLGKVIWTGVRE